MERKLLILGLDPGTTVGFALLDLHGNIVKIDSGKNFNLNSLISEVVKFGKVVVVASDKCKEPKGVMKVASNLRAKLICPKEDISLEEKRLLVKAHFTEEELAENKYDNAHEKDALAAAVFAWKELRPKIEKAEIIIEQRILGQARDSRTINIMEMDRATINKISNIIKENLLKRGNINLYRIVEEIDRIDSENLEKNSGKKKQKLEAGQLAGHENEHRNFGNKSSEEMTLANSSKVLEDVKRLIKKIGMLEHENNILTDSNRKLRSEVGGLQRRFVSSNKGKEGWHAGGENSIEGKLAEKLQFKDRQTSFLKQEIAARDAQISRLNNEIAQMNSFISKIHGHILIKKIKNLSMEEVSMKLEELEIKNEDYLMVENIGIVSENSLNLLKGKIKIIIADKSNRLVENYFPVIRKSGLGLIESENFALAENKKVEAEISKINILDRILSDYRQEKEIV